MQRFRSALSALAIAALAAACSSPVKLDDKANVPVESRTPTPAGGVAPSAGSGAGGAGAGQAGQSQVSTVNVGNSAAAAAGAMRIVYFDFDSFAVKDEYRSVVETQARLYSRPPRSSVWPSMVARWLRLAASRRAWVSTTGRYSSLTAKLSKSK